MPTLLQINITANWGSHGKIAEAIGQLAISKGWESHIAYGRWYNPSQSTLYHIGNIADEYYHGIVSRIFDNHGLMSANATKKLITYIRQVSPDIIHLHNIHGYYLNYPILFRFLSEYGKPVVWTLHDCWAFTGHCAHFVTAGCEKWKTGCHDCPLKGDYPKSLIDRSKRNFETKKKLFAECTNIHIVAVSDWLAGLVRESFLGNKDIRVIKNGVDTDVFKPLPVSKNKIAEKVILGVSNVWNKDKGLFDFFRLRALLPKQFIIRIVGLTKEQINDLPNGIEGIERTESLLELVSLYSDADVFVNPTYADTFPTVNLEAMACGTPVVTYKTGGSPEAITPETGMVVKQGDLQSLAEAIIKVCYKGKDFYREACRARAVGKFNKGERFNDYIKLYQDVIGGG